MHTPLANLFPRELYANEIHLIPMTAEHIEQLTTLALHHRDPFDRLLLSKANVEALTIVSADETFDNYGLTRLW